MSKTLCFVTLLAALGSASADPGDAAYARALSEYEVCHYREAVADLREAAQAGNERAAQMLGMMLVVGPTLYGDQLPADAAEGLRWLRASASKGNEAAAFTVVRLTNGH
jgi:TPR repeat protein